MKKYIGADGLWRESSTSGNCDLQGGVTVRGIMGGKKCLDFVCVFGLVLPEILDISQLLPQLRHIISLVDPDIELPSASEHDGIVVVPPILAPAGFSDHLIRGLAKEPL